MSPTINHATLSATMKAVLKSKGVNDASLDHCVDSLIQTSLRGVDSHGIHLFPHYCRAVDGGRINKNPNFKITSTAASASMMNADHGFGHHAGAVAIDDAIEKAKKTGMSAIGVIDSSHFGAAAYFALRAADQDCIGWSFTNADALVKAHSSKEAFFGTNPICFTAPMEKEGPFCLDMATSTVSWNKIKNYRVANKNIPEEWAFDISGNSVTNPHDARSLRPSGDYKGFGLGMMVDILCAVLTGGIISKDLLPMFNSPIEEPRKISHFFMVMDISKFTDVKSFKKNLQDMADRIRMLPKVTEEEVMVAGDPEKKKYAKRITDGIPVDETIWKEFVAIDAAFSTCVM
ncbi:MAG: Ldh family oxidoreductase [Bacteroidetes bacterium]|nr:Ldh family oxidoreductase [Bacteroidota bacterium]